MKNKFFINLFIFFLLFSLNSCKTLDFFYLALNGKDIFKIANLGTNKINFKELDKVKLKGFSISDYHHPLVKKHLNNYILYGKPTLKNILTRGSVYLPMIKRIFQDQGIPEDLAYLPIIESGFNPFAHSQAGAKGLWQFIYSTGVLYRLKANYWHDDRQDVYRSTVAAAYHLKYLYKNLKDWLLVLSAYNAGLGKINTAMKRYKTDNYWELIKYKYIKPETKNYVPKFIAATILAKNSQKYGIFFESIKIPKLETVIIEDATELNLLAKSAEISLKEFKQYNTSLNRWSTPPSKKYPIYIPQEKLALFKKNFSNIPIDQRITFRTYFVKLGDNLTGIADKFNVPINPIAEINKYTSLNNIYAGKNIFIPIKGLSKAKKIDQNQKTNVPIKQNNSLEKEVYTFIHITKNNDTLYDVAIKFKVTLKKLMKWNNLKSPNYLQKNHSLIIKKPI